MQYTEKELAKLIDTVEKEFTAHLTKAEEDAKSKLAKSEGAEGSPAQTEAPLAKAEDKKDEKSEAKPEEKKDEAKDEKSQEAPKAEAKADAKPEDKEAAPAAEESKEAAPAASHEDGCDYDDEDLEHMHKMYMSMSKGELKAHHDSVRKALDSQGMQKCGDMSMGKTETNTTASTQSIEVKAEDITKPTQELELAKSEAAGFKAKADALQKNLDTVQEFLTKLVKKTAPQGKAITAMEQIAKSESATESKELSKGEVTSILAKKAADPSLSKSDRDAINDFYLNGANINTINHLLK